MLLLFLKTMKYKAARYGNISKRDEWNEESYIRKKENRSYEKLK